MHLISEVFSYTLLFIALYFEVFFLITYFEFREKENKILRVSKEIKDSMSLTSIEPSKWPSVSVIIPVWNEDSTVLKTVFSLLRLKYPKDRLTIIIVDDGSVDNTWKVLQRFKNNKQVKLFKKENGGKYTALNYGLRFVTSDLVGCLDADSFVHPDAMRRIVLKFIADKDMMAVTPSIKIFEPKGFLGLLQKAEYIFGIFLRKVFSYLDAIYITPGPLSIFRRSVFERLGGYKHAHNTEDMELAMRMQKNNMKIGNAHDAFIYTVAPVGIRSLFKQRLRWVYGFIKNSIDYREMFLKPQYGNLGMIVLPAAGFSFVSTIYLFGIMLYNWAEAGLTKMKEISAIGISMPTFNFDFFYVNTDVVAFVSLIAILGTLLIIVTSRKMAGEKTKFGLDSILFLFFYTMIAPLWMTKALYNVVFARGNKWR